MLPDKHPLLERAVLTPEDFRGQPFISLSAADRYRQQIDQMFHQSGVMRRVIMETHSAAAVCAMVREGLGLAIVNPFTALDQLGTGMQIRRLSVPIPFVVSIVQPDHCPASQFARVFLETLVKEAGRISARLDHEAA